MKRIYYSILLFFVFNLTSWAQEGIPVYFDYLADNYYLVYPSMAGIGEGAKFTYAHHLRFGDDARNLNQLSFGLSGTILQSSLDETEFRSVNPDPAIVGSKISAAYFNTDLGMSYNFLEFYAHAAILNLLSSKRNLYYKDRTDNPNELEVDNLRRYLFSIGYVFGRGDWQLEPSLLLQMTDFTEEKSIDINAKVYKDVDFGKVWGGVSYRRSFDGAQYATSNSFGEQRLQLITPIVGVNYKNFMVSYNYSYQMGDIRFDNGGFHQITIGYDFLQSEKRYDCNCPAVNY